VQYRICAVIVIGAGAVLKICTQTEETLSEFEIYCADALASVFSALCSVNIVQHLCVCNTVIMAGKGLSLVA
jgi:hypothetical protein